ncbi:hypothetical protein [Mariniflexile sp. AS56]|uniref:hypothetical protein n=1 Tax=Mariniflexile sp. AS56 TaxID=3063957 RepID=UPI0026EF3BB2|nr:hypothetical protein [Mariniflexile sp. AS56]MDO7171935.1 hypothetical protein [Mariniflexile sp. AS56]
MFENKNVYLKTFRTDMSLNRKMGIILLIVGISIGLLTVVAAVISYKTGVSDKNDNEDRDRKIDLLLKVAYMDDSDPMKKQFLAQIKSLSEAEDDEIANILNDSYLEGRGLLEKALSYYIADDYFKSLGVFEYIRSNTKDDYELAISDSFIGRIYLNNILEKGVKPETYFIEALSLFNKYNLDTEIFLIQKAEIHTDLGILYKQKGEIEKAREQYDYSLNLYKRLNFLYSGKYNINIGKQYQNIYSLYSGYNKFYDSLLLEAYDFKKKAYEAENNYVSSYLNTISSLGKLYVKQGEFNQARTYFDEGEELINAVSNKDYLGEDFLFIVIAFYINFNDYYSLIFYNTNNSDDLKLAKFYLEKAEQEFKSFKNIEGPKILRVYAACLYGLGLVNYNLNIYDKSLEYYEKSKKVRISLIDSENRKGVFEIELAHVYYGLAKLFDNKSFVNYDKYKAEFYAKNAIDIYVNFVNVDVSLGDYIDSMELIINN